MDCPICTAPRRHAFSAVVLGSHNADYHYCDVCGFLGAADPHWLDEAYSSAIAAMDTGVVGRNMTLAARCTPIIYSLLGPSVAGSEPCLDFAGGHGLFTRIMRDIGFNYFWSDRYAPNLYARGFDYLPAVGRCGLVSAMEVMEHAVDPVGLVKEAFDLADPQYFLFTTELFSGEPPPPDDWWYYAFETGQHISFYQERTLAELGRRLGLAFRSFKGLHLFSRTSVGPRLLLGQTPLRQLSNAWVRSRLEPRTMSDFRQIQHRLRATSRDGQTPD